MKRITFRQKIGLLWSLYRDKRTPLAVKVLPILAVIYGVSPIDFVPDFLPLLGQMDDIVMIASLLLAAYNMIPKDLYRQERERVQATPITNDYA
jgi:uncharacterized membrane protein YkvA (DUF1232 family)